MNSKISKTPREVVQELDQFIVGQASAKRALAVALRNRYRRLLLDEEMQKEVTPKNLLMIGPTGVGKTELARRLAKLVDAPFVKVEATKFTEVGYVGRDVESMVRDLVENAISIVQKQKQEDVRPQAYDKAVRKLAKILKPGIMKKVANPQQDSLMNLFQSMGLPKTDLPQEEKEEVTEEIAASRREIEQQGYHGGEVSREGVQRDILPIVEGSQVQTKYGAIQTDHILFIASGAFHVAKPSDLMPELQGRFPIRVELQDLSEEDFERILTEPKNALLKQYKALLATENVEVIFTKEAVSALARTAFEVNSNMENIGARRLHTILETLLEELLFEAPQMQMGSIQITEQYVESKLNTITADRDLTRYIL